MFTITPIQCFTWNTYMGDYPHPHVGKPPTPTPFRGVFFGWTVPRKILSGFFRKTRRGPHIEAYTRQSHKTLIKHHKSCEGTPIELKCLILKKIVRKKLENYKIAYNI